MQRRHFEQLATPESWQSPVSVIAHIDLDAFYAQCLSVRYKLDPQEPLGCRQWSSLIAVNYPAREFGIKRGMNADEARKLCPRIHMPHVATFKKGETEWKFHDDPDPYNYKVSLDPFRRESRRIFAVFKKHFRMVEKAGIDEGFIDLGPEIHRQFVLTRPEVTNSDSKTMDITYEQLLEIGAQLVKDVRDEIFRELSFTCSAGIAPNKLLAKLGSQFRKPNNQTTVYPNEIGKFLANFRITDAWGWGGKHGKDVLERLGIDPRDLELDQCEFVRENFDLADLEKRLGSFPEARRVYDLVRGKEVSELKPRTLTKSLVAVKNFTTGLPIQTEADLHMWLRVFAADLAGRVADMQDDFGSVIAPKTIGVKFHANKALHSRQQQFEGSGMNIDHFREQIYTQSKAVGLNFLPIPCRYLVVEIAGLAALPKERLMFQKTTRDKALTDVKSELIDGGKPTGTNNPANSGNVTRANSPIGTETKPDLGDEPLFVDDDDDHIVCPRCQAEIELKDRQEHEDWHFAKDLQKSDYAQKRGPPAPKSSPQRKRASPSTSKNKRDPGQQTIFQFFKK